MATSRVRKYGCPVELALTVIGGKWKTVLLARLKEKPMSYGELRRAIPELSDKVLTHRLKDLVKEGLIERSKAGRRGGLYSLSDDARSLTPALEALYDWGSEVASRRGAKIRESDR